jgi:hypothetical protein
MRTGIAWWCVALACMLLTALSPAAMAADGVITRLQFRDRVVARLEAANPDFKVKVLSLDELEVTGVGEGEVRMYLGNAYRQYLSDPSSLDQVIMRFVGVAVSATAAEAEDAPLAPADLRLLIRPAGFLDEVGKMRARSGKPTLDTDLPVSRPLAGDLVVLLGLDHPQSYSYPPRATVEEALPSADAWTRALTNTGAAVGKIRTEALRDGVSMVTTESGLGPSLLLLDNVWTQAPLKGQGDPIVVVFSRTALLLGHEGDPESIDALVAILKAERAFAGNDLVSDQLFIRRNGRWEVFDPAAPRRMPREASLDRAA